MSTPSWWASQPAEFKFLTTDQYGMMALHTTRPYLHQSGKWLPTGNGRRKDLGLRQIDGSFSPGSSLEVRPGAEDEPAQPNNWARDDAPSVPVPKGVDTQTPPEHLVSAPRTDAFVPVTKPVELPVLPPLPSQGTTPDVMTNPPLVEADAKAFIEKQVPAGQHLSLTGELVGQVRAENPIATAVLALADVAEGLARRDLGISPEWTALQKLKEAATNLKKLREEGLL